MAIVKPTLQCSYDLKEEVQKSSKNSLAVFFHWKLMKVECLIYICAFESVRLNYCLQGAMEVCDKDSVEIQHNIG